MSFHGLGGGLARHIAGKTWQRRGNRHASYAPQGVYPCAGEDRWGTLTVASDAQYGALCQLVDLPAISPEHPVSWLAGALHTADACLLIVDLGDPACVERIEALQAVLHERRVTLTDRWDPVREPAGEAAQAEEDPFALRLPAVLLANKADLLAGVDAELRAFLDRSRGWLREHTPKSMWATPTGAAVMFSFISQRNIEGMLGGNALAIVLIAVIMILSLRSLRLGALSLIPNVVPILMTFGLWALLVNQVGMAAATVSATSLGIIVDNTVHFLTKYLRARREKGFDRPQAIRYTFETVGMAMAVNALILALGFAVLAASTFKINAEMGLLTAMAILIALVVDFLLLPALLLIGYDRKKGESDEQTGLAKAA